MQNKAAFTIPALATLALASATFGCASDSGQAEAEVAPAPWETPDGSNRPTPQGELETVKTGFGFTEGPAVDAAGNVFFTDQPNDTIFRWDAASGEVTTFLEGTGRANGMAFDEAGYLVACADLHGEIWRIGPDGTHEVLASGYGGKLLNGPNDVWINHETGGMYITDPMFPRDYWDEDDPRKQAWPPTRSEQAESGISGHVYYLAPGASELVRVTTMADWDADSWPNGVVGTPDGKRLYVNRWASDNRGGTFAFDIAADGTLSNMVEITETGGDGMSLDEQGNLYISNGLGVQIFTPDGELLSTIATDAGRGKGATNNVFAGAEGKTLFITGPSDRVVTVEMNVAGVEKW